MNLPGPDWSAGWSATNLNSGDACGRRGLYTPHNPAGGATPPSGVASIPHSDPEERSVQSERKGACSMSTAGAMLVTTSSHAVPFERTIPRRRLTVLAAAERIVEARCARGGWTRSQQKLAD